MSRELNRYVELIKSKSKELGFSGCGISIACKLEDEAGNLEKWLKTGQHGDMKYMENYFDKRLDPRKLVDGAKSVISVIYNYFPPLRQQDPGAPVLSKYAYGVDYHAVVKDKLRELYRYINEKIGEVHGRCFVDSAPVMDKVWAKRSGLGWIGKNTNLLVKGTGSFFFIGELIIDLKLPPDNPGRNYCGNCTLCIDACPTNALARPFQLDSNRCISYLTIEYRNAFPETLKGEMHNRVFGCDICQDVCPWNRMASPHRETAFLPVQGLMDMTRDEWFMMSEEQFNIFFDKSALQRIGYKQLKRNLKVLQNT